MVKIDNGARNSVLPGQCTAISYGPPSAQKPPTPMTARMTEYKTVIPEKQPISPTAVQTIRFKVTGFGSKLGVSPFMQNEE